MRIQFSFPPSRCCPELPWKVSKEHPSAALPAAAHCWPLVSGTRGRKRSDLGLPRLDQSVSVCSDIPPKAPASSQRCRRKKPPAIPRQCAEEEKHCKGTGELRASPGGLMDVSLPAPCSRVAVQTLPGTPGCCTGEVSPAHTARPGTQHTTLPSTGYGPDLTLTQLPCPDDFWTPPCWELRLGKPHLEKAFSMAV